MESESLPRVFGLMVVRDEADIIAQTLRHARRYCERVFVIDNGSTDGTVETIESLAAEDPGIELSIRTTDLYERSMRGRLLAKHRAAANEGDWWQVIDADEMLPYDPRAFLLRAGQERENKVYVRMITFIYTEAEYAAWQAGEETVADRQRPILERRRWYRSAQFEARFFRHGTDRAWPAQFNVPFVRGRVCRHAFPLFHFPARDAAQIGERIALRKRVREEQLARGQSVFDHVAIAEQTVEDVVQPEDGLHRLPDDGWPFFAEVPRPMNTPRTETRAYWHWRILRWLGRTE